MDENQISYTEIDEEIEARATAKRHKLPHEIFDFAELLLIVLAVLLLATTFLFRQTVVIGGSMNPTLREGERLLISDFFYTPKAGDIIVFQADGELASRANEIQENEAIVKRVIATEGQTVRISGGIVYVDGMPLSEDYTASGTGNMKEITVSEGHIFVLGDNRNNSVDSRRFGEVDERTVLGKVLLRLLPLSSFGGVE
jgi:signal peptidase I